MLKKLFSIWLWFTGGLFFLFSFLILVVCMFLLPQKTTFQIARFLFGILIRIMGIRLVVTGLENIEYNKSYLIMGNHQSLFDVFVIPAAIPICFTGIEAAYHFKLPVWGYLVRKWGCIPIERNNLKSAISSLKIATKTLMSGMNIAVLPEGHRTLTGEIAPFKKGPFHLAKGAKSDILPFAVSGLFEYHQKSSLILNPGEVKVNIGRPFPYDEFKELSTEVLRQCVFENIADLKRL
jgi:1-acyl-sn-glycerol-3-phosphate acyltransferase